MLGFCGTVQNGKCSRPSSRRPPGNAAAILQAPQREEFARETISKIRHWRFHPYHDEHGQAKEVSHELTVVFNIVRAKRR